MLNRSKKIYLAGHTGLIGRYILGVLKSERFKNIIVRNHSELDLERQASVESFFKNSKPSYCILAAAKVGGIFANRTYTAEFIYENLMIEANVIHAAYLSKVKKLLFYASACSYPVNSAGAMKEEYFLTGKPEETNIAYAVAKIAGVTLCQSYRKQFGCNFICAVPTNTYGPGDNFNEKDAHVIPALIRKFHNAKYSGRKSVVLWGSEKPKREFIYSEDVALASVFLMDHYNDGEIINIGTQEEISVKDLAYLIKEIVGYKGKIVFDTSKPDGAMRKLLDSRRIEKLGWKAKTQLYEGISKTYQWFTKEYLKKA